MFLKISMLLLFIACLFIAIPFVEAQLPLDGVVSYWPFDDGTGADILGDNDGELMGNPKSVAGKVGKALEFDGKNSVHIPGTDSLDLLVKKR